MNCYSCGRFMIDYGDYWFCFNCDVEVDKVKLQ